MPPKAAKQEKKVILIDKSGTTKEIGITDPNTLYKKAGFKTSEGFDEQFVWEIVLDEVKYTVTVHAKKTGRVPKNAYGFPPPLEDATFYGNCIVICQERDLTIKLWDSLFESIYEKYDDNDEEEEEEDDDDYEPLEEDEEEEEEEVAVDEDVDGGKPAKKKSAAKSSRKKDELAALFVSADVQEHYLDCSEELALEEYV